jgi:hypothetical protein
MNHGLDTVGNGLVLFLDRGICWLDDRVLDDTDTGDARRTLLLRRGGESVGGYVEVSGFGAGCGGRRTLEPYRMRWASAWSAFGNLASMASRLSVSVLAIAVSFKRGAASVRQ